MKKAQKLNRSKRPKKKNVKYVHQVTNHHFLEAHWYRQRKLHQLMEKGTMIMPSDQ